VIVVDTSILIAIIREEVDAPLYIDILDDTAAIMSTVSYVEAHGRNRAQIARRSKTR
jgi:uncharacterized protein with PIN domain